MRGTIITTAALSLMTATLVLAQQDPSIAQAMLEQKQKERDAARAEKITITLGELDDLRQENKRLRGEVEMLKQKLGISADRPPAPETRRYTEIEIGMSKPELVAFVKQRSNVYRIGSFSAEAGGVVTDREETVINSQRNGTGQFSGTGNATATVTRYGEASSSSSSSSLPRTRTRSGTLDGDGNATFATTQNSVTSVERRRVLAKKEKVTIDVIGYRPGVIGTESNAQGRHDVIGNVKAVTGRIYVELTDDVVTVVRINDLGY